MDHEDRDRAIADVRDHIRWRVAAGFDSPDDVIRSTLDLFGDDAIPLDELEPLAEELTHGAVVRSLTEQKSWPELTDCDRLDGAFDELARVGVVGRQNFSCCGNCGVAEIGDEMDDERAAGLAVRGYVFYHEQDTEAATEGCGLHLSFGAVEPGEAAAVAVGAAIVRVMREQGLDTVWDGRAGSRILVLLDWKRRLPRR